MLVDASIFSVSIKPLHFPLHWLFSLPVASFAPIQLFYFAVVCFLFLFQKTPERQGERSKGKAKEKPRLYAGFVCYLSLLLHPPAPECYALGHQINLGGDMLSPLINQNHN